MSEDVKKDIGKRLRTTSYVGLTASEAGFDNIDKTAKKLSSKLSESRHDTYYESVETIRTTEHQNETSHSRTAEIEDHHTFAESSKLTESKYGVSSEGANTIRTNEYKDEMSRFGTIDTEVYHPSTEEYQGANVYHTGSTHESYTLNDIKKKTFEQKEKSLVNEIGFHSSTDASSLDYEEYDNEVGVYENYQPMNHQDDIIEKTYGYDYQDDFYVSPSEINDELPSRIKTSSEADRNPIHNNFQTDELSYDDSYYENAEDITYGEDDEQFDKIVEGTEKTKNIRNTVLHKLNKGTFDFKESQGNVSKSFTVAGKSGKALSKGGKALLRTSRSINKAMEEKDSGIGYIQDNAYRKTSRKVVKKTKKPVKNLIKKSVKAIFRKIKNIFKKKLAKILLCASVGIEVLPIMGAVVAGVVTVTSIFGGAASSATLTKYENYMQSIQESYDRKVDDFMKRYPDGIVVGVNGGYGKIDWKVPLSIIQGCDGNISYSAGERDILNKFKAANLFEKHTISEQKIHYEDKGKDKVKTIKVLTITNPGYEDYMRWSKNNFDKYKIFLQSKGIYKNNQRKFDKNQLEVINKLYNSEMFFDAFSEEFQEHDTSTGSNKTEKNFNSPEYNNKNIFANAGFKGQCTWYAYGRALKVTGKKMPSGNAQTWLSSAVAMGMPTGSKPSVNAVIVLSGGGFGHVAFVEAWDGKKITVSEGNYRNPYYNNPDMMVSYAREHAVELVHEETYKSFEEYKRRQTAIGLTVVGFIYDK